MRGLNLSLLSLIFVACFTFGPVEVTFANSSENKEEQYTELESLIQEFLLSKGVQLKSEIELRRSLYDYNPANILIPPEVTYFVVTFSFAHDDQEVQIECRLDDWHSYGDFVIRRECYEENELGSYLQDRPVQVRYD